MLMFSCGLTPGVPNRQKSLKQEDCQTKPGDEQEPGMPDTLMPALGCLALPHQLPSAT